MIVWLSYAEIDFNLINLEHLCACNKWLLFLPNKVINSDFTKKNVYTIRGKSQDFEIKTLIFFYLFTYGLIKRLSKCSKTSWVAIGIILLPKCRKRHQTMH